MASKKQAANDAAAELVVLPAGTPKSTDLVIVVDELCDGLMATNIDSALMYELAAAELVDMQAKYKELEEQRLGITRPMDAAKKKIMDLFRSPLEKLASRIAAHKAGMLAYDAEQKRKAAIQQALLDKIANEQRQRIEAEAAAQAEEARVQSELAAKLIKDGTADGAAVAEALDKAEAAQERATAYQATGLVVSAATAATNVPAVEGVTTADVWKARVTDLPALLRYIADNPACHEWIELKMTGLNDLAKAQRTELRIPGVEAYEGARISAARTSARKAA